MEPTTCDRTTELLPWLLNDSLDESERREVEDHLRSCPACRRALAETRSALELFAAHPPAAAIVARAELDDQAAAGADAGVVGFPGGSVGRATLDAHLEHCAACREELELARESRRLVEGEDEPARGESRRPAREPGVVVPLARPAAPGAERRFDWRPLALAASLLLAVVSAGGWLFTAQEAADRRDRTAELEERGAPARPGAPAGETPAGEGATPGAAGDPEATIAELQARIDELSGDVEAANAAAAAAAAQVAGLAAEGERLDELLANPRVHLHFEPIVQRGGGGRAAEVSRSEGLSIVAVFPQTAEIELGDGRLSWRLRGADGEVLDPGGELERRRHPDAGEYVAVGLVTGGLPLGEVELVLFEGRREVASIPLRVVP